MTSEVLSELRVAQVAREVEQADPLSVNFRAQVFVRRLLAQTRLVLNPLFPVVVAVKFVALKILEPSRDLQVLLSLKALTN